MTIARQNPRDILEKSAARDMGEALDPPLLHQRQKRPHVNARRFEQYLGQSSPILRGEACLEIPALLFDNPADERKAVAVHAGAGESEDHVAGLYVPASEHLVAVDCANAKAGEVIIARRIHPRHLSRFAPDQRTTGLSATLSDRGHNRGRDVIVELPGRVIIQEKQRLGALHDEVVGAHRDKVDADRIMTPGVDRELELRPNAVIRGDQQRIGVASGLEIEESPEPAKLRVRARPGGGASERTDRPDESISSVDRHSCVGISQRLVAHCGRALETIRLDFHAVVAKRRTRMLRRRLLIPFLLLIAAVGLGGALYAQLESGDRGILPLDSSNTLEIGGIHVDVGGADAQSARYAGWRIAQRQGFKALWAKMHNAPFTQAPNLPDGTLDQIVSSVNVEHEQIGPNRYIADLGVQ